MARKARQFVAVSQEPAGPARRGGRRRMEATVMKEGPADLAWSGQRKGYGYAALLEQLANAKKGSVLKIAGGGVRKAARYACQKSAVKAGWEVEFAESGGDLYVRIVGVAESNGDEVRAVLAVVRESGTALEVEIVGRTKLAPAVVRAALEKLAAAGKVEKDDHCCRIKR